MHILIKILFYILFTSCVILMIFSIKVLIIDIKNRFPSKSTKKPPDKLDFLVDLSMFSVGFGGALLTLRGLGYF